MCSECALSVRACFACARFYGRCHLHSNLGFEMGGIHIYFLRCTLCVLHQPLRCNSYYLVLFAFALGEYRLHHRYLNTVGSGPRQKRIHVRIAA